MNDILFYTLDGQGQPVPTTDVRAWGRWMVEADGTGARIIGKDAIEGLTVSTVFLGIAYCNPDLNDRSDDTRWPQMLYETMVFGPPGLVALVKSHTPEETSSVIAQVFGGVDFQRRYRTRAEAMAGHVETVALVRRAMASRNWRVTEGGS